MYMIISPAKRMRTDTDTLPPRDLPAFLPEAERLLGALRALPPGSGKPCGGAAMPLPPATRSAWGIWICTAD